MAISTYQDIQDAVARWLARSDLVENIPDFIAFAELRLCRKLTIPPTEGLVELGVDCGRVLLPNDYIKAKEVHLLRTKPIKLESKPYAFVRERTKQSGTPQYFSRRASSFLIAPAPAQDETIELYYYRTTDPLGSQDIDGNTITCNWFTTNAPDLLIYGALVEAKAFLFDDDRIPLWETKFTQVINDLQNLSDSSEFSGGSLRADPG